MLSLTVARLLPVAIAMIASGARISTVLFLSWVGPRGLASIVVAVIVVDEAHLPKAQTILTATYVTIGLSVLAHRITAAPLARRYARWYESHPPDGRPVMESFPPPTVRNPRNAEPRSRDGCVNAPHRSDAGSCGEPRPAWGCLTCGLALDLWRTRGGSVERGGF